VKEPHWLSFGVTLAIHSEVLARFGGQDGVRDEGLLRSALDRPRNQLAHGRTSLFDLAADYAAGIIRNHPFMDGNKRTGFIAAYTFLGINGQRLEATEEDAVLKTLALAAGEIDASAYAAWLEQSCVPLAPRPAAGGKGRQRPE
jgi:death on curing protein